MRYALLLVGSFLAIGQPSARAGLYGPEQPSPFTVDAVGLLKELVYVPVFKSLLDDRFNGLNPASALTLEGRPTFRGAALNRLAELPVADVLGRSATLLRLGRFDDAVNLLQPQSRSRTPNYALLMNLAHAHTGRGEFDEAIRTHASALLDADAPSELPGLSVPLTVRVLKLEREHYAKRLRQRRTEANRRLEAEIQEVPDLFGMAEAPMRWVDERGNYKPGTLAPTERAKLPKDAVAVVQQLLLWSPEDTPLLWLLAELYAADGRLREAEQVFDQLTWGRNFTNRKTLMEHRTAVREAAANLPPEQADAIVPDAADVAPPPDDDAKWRELRAELAPFVLGFAGLTLLGIALFAFTLVRRDRKKRR